MHVTTYQLDTAEAMENGVGSTTNQTNVIDSRVFGIHIKENLGFQWKFLVRLSDTRPVTAWRDDCWIMTLPVQYVWMNKLHDKIC